MKGRVERKVYPLTHQLAKTHIPSIIPEARSPFAEKRAPDDCMRKNDLIQY